MSTYWSIVIIPSSISWNNPPAPDAGFSSHSKNKKYMTASGWNRFSIIVLAGFDGPRTVTSAQPFRNWCAKVWLAKKKQKTFIKRMTYEKLARHKADWPPLIPRISAPGNTVFRVMGRFDDFPFPRKTRWSLDRNDTKIIWARSWRMPEGAGQGRYLDYFEDTSRKLMMVTVNRAFRHGVPCFRGESSASQSHILKIQYFVVTDDFQNSIEYSHKAHLLRKTVPIRLAEFSSPVKRSNPVNKSLKSEIRWPVPGRGEKRTISLRLVPTGKQGC